MRRATLDGEDWNSVPRRKRAPPKKRIPDKREEKKVDMLEKIILFENNARWSIIFEEIHKKKNKSFHYKDNVIIHRQTDESFKIKELTTRVLSDLKTFLTNTGSVSYSRIEQSWKKTDRMSKSYMIFKYCERIGKKYDLPPQEIKTLERHLNFTLSKGNSHEVIMERKMIRKIIPSPFDIEDGKVILFKTDNIIPEVSAITKFPITMKLY